MVSLTSAIRSFLLRREYYIEGTARQVIKPTQIRAYFARLAKVCGVVVSFDSVHYGCYGGYCPRGVAYAGAYIFRFRTLPTIPQVFSVEIKRGSFCSLKKIIGCTRGYFDPIDIVGGKR